MWKLIGLLITIALWAKAQVAFAQTDPRWGLLHDFIGREWRTVSEPVPRTSFYYWVQPDVEMTALHGRTSLLADHANFADTEQLLRLNPESGLIEVTYLYRDGRPALISTMRIQPDGTLVENFVDAQGVQRRNIYRSPIAGRSLVERQVAGEAGWETVAITDRLGPTFAEAEAARQEDRDRELARARSVQEYYEERDRQIAEGQREAAADRLRVQRAYSDGLRRALGELGGPVPLAFQPRDPRMEDGRLPASDDPTAAIEAWAPPTPDHWLPGSGGSDTPNNGAITMGSYPPPQPIQTPPVVDAPTPTPDPPAPTPMQTCREATGRDCVYVSPE